MAQFPIVGTRILLRPWTRRDRSTIAHWPAHQQPEAWSNPGVVQGPRERLAIVRQADAQLIGRLTLRDRQGDTARIGIALHPLRCGQGYGSEALQLLITALPQLGLQRLRLDVAAANGRAVGAYRRAGFVVVDQFWRDGLPFWEMQCTLLSYSASPC